MGESFEFILQTEFSIFVTDESAAEIGTSKASMNRCGKTNTAKEVHNHYNEYKDFHSREMETHICASFMHMCGITKIEGTLVFTVQVTNTTQTQRKDK